MLYFPDIPDVPESQTTSGTSYLRYDEISQDGRVQVIGLAHNVGLVWRRLLSDNEIAHLSRQQGIVPILSRMIMCSTNETVSVSHPLVARGGYALAHTKDDAGEINRLLLNLWVDLTGPRSRTHAPPPPGHGTIVSMGKVWSEHVFTRPFGPKEQRKVLSLPGVGLTDLPADEYPWRAAAAVMAIPRGATAIDSELRTDPTPIVFGLSHTDSNQHVNSLQYPRMFTEAVLRRLAENGRPTALLPDYVEISYRKPCFAGNELRIALQTFELAGGAGLGAIGCFIARQDADAPSSARPHCCLRMTLVE